MVELTEQDLEEIDRIINETEAVWDYIGVNPESGDSLQGVDASQTLADAARRVREYLKAKEKKD